MRRAAIVAFSIACTTPLPPRALPVLLPPDPQPDPIGVIDAETYTARVGSLRATLARSHIELDDRPVAPFCGLHHGIDDCLRCEVASRADTSGIDPDMIDAIAIAFARYPSTVLIASRLEHVTLCRQIRYDHDHGVDPAGLASFDEARLFVSIEYFSDKAHEHYGDFTIEQIVHHELFHMLDHAAHGEAVYADREWEALDPPAFAYRDPADLDSPRPAGFVNSYATTNELEDRASTFEFLMGQSAKLCAIAAVDPIVAAKARMVWSRVGKLVGDRQLPPEAQCLNRKPAVPAKPTRPLKPSRPTKPRLQLPTKPSLVGKMW
jgi:hypothetical protein